MSKNKHPLTRFLVTTNALIFFLGVFFSIHRELIQTYGFSMDAVAAQHWEVFFTSGFLHSDVGHLLYNMFFLWVFGRTCEEAFGWSRTAMLYFTSMIMGSLFFGILFPGQSAVGASGAVSGLVAAAILVEPGRDIYPATGSMPIVLLAILFLIPTMLNAFNLAGNTANIAHVGGVFAGAVLALFWDTEQALKNMKQLWPLWAGIGGVVLMLLLTSII